MSDLILLLECVMLECPVTDIVQSENGATVFTKNGDIYKVYK